MNSLKTLFCIMFSVSFCCAQSTPTAPVPTSIPSGESKLFVGYMYARSDYYSKGPLKNYNGAAAQLDLMRNHRWGAAIDGSYGKSNLDSSEWQLLFGPRVQFGGTKSSFGVSPWVGFGYIRRKLSTSPTSLVNHESGISHGVGGDWSLRLSKRFSYRLGADYLRPPFGVDKNSDWFRMTTGIAIGF
jgi:hypothetical protein